MNIHEQLTADSRQLEPESESETNQSKHCFNLKSALIGLAAIFLCGSVLFFSDLGSFPLFNPDEALYAEPAREMLVTGQYITTLLNYVVRYTKPPLVIWIMALSYKIFGVNEFAARCFGAGCGVFLIAATYLFCLRHASKRIAIIAALVLATSPLYIGTGREAITDMPLSLFVAGSLMAFFHGFQQSNKLWVALAYVLTGLAVMTKGPVAVVLP
ncbi:MAG TPA: glycosyltransferase family 39 protein, partial [Chroococcales cyanobacterium]